MSGGSRPVKNKSKMRYIGEYDSFSINGNITGRLYRFSAKNQIVSVDSRDADTFVEVQELQRVS